MSAFDFTDLQELLLGWPAQVISSEPFDDGLFERVRQILSAALAAGRLTRKQDLMPLIRQVLLRQSAVSGGSMSLKVPQSADWPTIAEWSAWGVNALPVSQGLLLTARRWQPDWLAHADQGVFDAAFAGEARGQDMSCRADPFVEACTGLTDYKTNGQREAIRAAFLAPPGSTLIINLPTGNGKSLVGQIDVLLDGKEGSLTLVVVPTVALALDQERQMRARMAGRRGQPEQMAWHAGLSAEEKQAIKERIRLGNQKILFAAPESVCGSLVYALYDAARQGFLRRLVVDEAHLVAQWGDEFRPSFQLLAGLRNGLLRVCPDAVEPFTTLLLSATLTEETLDTLVSLFGPRDRVQIVSAVQLRQEPAYWFHRAASAEEKLERLAEAVRHAPRPFILYVNERQDANDLRDFLCRELGLTRLARFHGDTVQSERQLIIDQWSANALDVIVATSAFGVGIDKTDVRCVLHACVPETLDRFYQEVGRGGRDGRASVSLTIYDASDLISGKQLGVPTLISDELGVARWRAMLKSNSELDDDRINVDVSVVPSHGKQQSDYNKIWNVRTLILLARAGVIRLDSEPPPTVEREQGESDADYEARLEKAADQYFNGCAIHILNPRHQEAHVWETAVAAAKQRSAKNIDRNYVLLTSVLAGKKEISDALTELYQVDDGPWSIGVSGGCSGCPVCRTSGERRYGALPVTAPLEASRRFNTDAWAQYLPSRSPEQCLVLIQEGAAAANTRLRILRALEAAVAQFSVVEINVSDPGYWRREPVYLNLYRKSPHRFVLENDLTSAGAFALNSALPAATVIYPGPCGSFPMDVLYVPKPLHLLFIPENLPDPVNPARRLADVWSNNIELEQFIRRVQA